MTAVPRDPLGLGIDLVVDPDLPEQQRLQSGLSVLGADLAHRLQTPPGTLFYLDAYGYDLRALLHARLDAPRLAAAQAQIRAEVLRDPRVSAATVALSLDPGRRRLSVEIKGRSAAGPFALVLAVTPDIVELARVEALS